ncbi:MAG TPA: GxxExxY protein [Gemmatimonadales bacterium]|nr:GxxExxY protein [Gemmatimonadales bacterium]
MDGTEQVNRWTEIVIGLALKVHKRLGPGLLEHVYRKCLAYEIAKAGLEVAAEVPVSLAYDDLRIEAAYRLDILVENAVIVEVKAVEKVLPVHHSQLLTYLRLDSKPVGIFFNFNTNRLSDDLKRMVNNP